MEVMEHYLPDFPMNLSILLFLMGLLNLTTLEDFPEKSDHREGIIIKGPQESRFPQETSMKHYLPLPLVDGPPFRRTSEQKCPNNT